MDSNFESFADYLAERLPEISVNLDIKNSKFCDGIQKRLSGIEEVLNAYQWKSSWADCDGIKVHSDDWVSTKQSLRQLSGQLQEAVKSEGEKKIFEVAQRVLQWGGNRDPQKGAQPFLQRVLDKNELSSYLNDSIKVFDLSQKEMPDFKSIQLMNAMLTKVHALIATDGLPIYDSRVAATIAVLAEQFRRTTRLNSLPTSIQFPTTDAPNSKRHAKAVYKDAVGARVLYRNSSNLTLEWSSAKWRLGKLIRRILEKRPELFANEGDLPERCHAMEAAFFMMGYDPKAIVLQT